LIWFWLDLQEELVLAIYEVGQCFFHGWGVPQDKKMAVVRASVDHLPFTSYSPLLFIVRRVTFRLQHGWATARPSRNWGIASPMARGARRISRRRPSGIALL
jgi:hypothetical protein